MKTKTDINGVILEKLEKKGFSKEYLEEHVDLIMATIAESKFMLFMDNNLN